MRFVRDLIALLVAGLVIAWIISDATVAAQDRLARDRCFSAAGRVEHYDGDKPDVWRCVGANVEGE